MKNRYAASILAAALLSFGLVVTQAQDPGTATPAASAVDPSKLNEKQSVSYLIGTQVGQSLHQNQIELDYDLFMTGLREATAGKQCAIEPAKQQEIMQAFQMKMMAAKQAEAQKEGAANLATANKFLEENKTKEGVITTASGLQYQVLAAGEGASPNEASTVKVRYKGVFLDGSEFDSNLTAPEPSEFKVVQLVAGWQEALKLMKPGAKFKLWVPPGLAYGTSGRPGIPVNAMLIFEMELISFT